MEIDLCLNWLTVHIVATKKFVGCLEDEKH